VAPSGKEQVGVLVIRVWAERGGPSLRARLIGAIDLDAPRRSVSTAGSVEDTLAHVQRWLASFQAL
jgi:hypothetical protein